MAELAIKGHSTRSKEVIQLLNMLGGTNEYFKHDGKIENFYYYIGNNNHIYQCGLPSEMKCFTLEEFLEKYPYKVGDCVVNHKYGKGDITQMFWINNEIVYEIHFEDCMEYCKANELCKYDVFKGLLAQELKEHLGNATPEQLEEDWKELEKFSEVGPVADEYIKQCVEFVKPYEEENMEEKDEPKAPILSNRYYYAEGKCGYVIPDGYEFDYIKEGFQTEIILKPKKPTYPKTYEECCEVLGISRHDVEIDLPQPYQQKMFNLFKLHICLDAYWKIAGEQMGLGKPWEPDWDNLSTTHEFIKIYKGCFIYSSRVLVFPTKEMRDAFFNNFKELIESCKELL